MSNRSVLIRQHARSWRPIFCALVLSGCSTGTVLDKTERETHSAGDPRDAGPSVDGRGEQPSDQDGSTSDTALDAGDVSSSADPDPAVSDDGSEPVAEDPVAPDAPEPMPEPTDGETPDRATKLTHPGVLNSQVELDLVRARVAANQQPWLNAFKALSASKYAAASYQARPFSEVACGSYNQPNEGCTEMVEDGMAVYAHALLWSITGEQRHADKAMQIIDAWAVKYQKNTESNARLVAAWATPWYVNGAEILRYSDAGWTEPAIARFTGMLKKLLPYVKENTRPENNWIQSRIEAHMAIAVFLDSPDELNQAVERFRFWLPIYIYQKSDGKAPVNPPGRTSAQTYSIWKSSAASTSFVDGLAMETCRDLGHLGLGFNSMMYAAETAYQQGIDLFTPNKKRLADFMELHGSFTTGTLNVPSNICAGVIKVPQADKTGIKAPEGGGNKAWEIAYNHLHDRLGMTLPFTQEMLAEQRPTGGARWVSKWETLTHAGRTVE